MKVIEKISEAREHNRLRQNRAVLVPTMGALHRGHLELMKMAREYAGESGEVIVSIFVNPLQFEPGSDFEKYPRPIEKDEELCREAGADILFRPSPEEMYRDDESVFIVENQLSLGLEGKSRPGHFRGVCTVVAKLFNILQPSGAVFGEKDFQQLAIIRRMVRDLNLPVEIIVAPTVREKDGLALSSRNQYLTRNERQNAAVLYRAEIKTRELIATGENSAAALIRAATQEIQKAKDARIDYVQIVSGESLQPLEMIEPDARMVMAVFIGPTRLIDNMPLA